MLRIGCHLSASKGLLAAARAAKGIGANTFQFFTRNPRGGKAKAADPEDARAFLAFARENGIGPVVAHAPYTLNLCSASEKTRAFAAAVLKDDLARMEYIPGNFYNLHPGSASGQGAEEGIRLICAALNAAVAPGLSTTVLLETMAGKGTEVGRSFGELRRILGGAEHPEKLGVCLDTCHVFDAGYDVRDSLGAVLEEFDRAVGLKKLRAVHLNDSKNALGSRRDRHEKIGLGSIGFEAFARIVTHPALRGLPFILETPNDLPGYAGEIARLRRAAGEAV